MECHKFSTSLGKKNQLCLLHSECLLMIPVGIPNHWVNRHTHCEGSAEHQWFSHSVVCCPPAIMFHILHPSFLAIASSLSQSCYAANHVCDRFEVVGRWGQEELHTLLFDLLMLRISDSSWKMANACSSNENLSHEVSHLCHGVCLFNIGELS